MKARLSFAKKLIFALLILLSGAGYASAFDVLYGAWPKTGYWQTASMNWYQDVNAPQLFKDENFMASTTWWDEGGAKFMFVKIGDTNASALFLGDGISTFGGVHLLPDDVLAATRCIGDPNNSSVIIECDIMRNLNIDWINSGIDIQSVSLHEFGHAARLGHSTNTNAVMAEEIGPYEIKRHLTQDDIDGIKYKYGAR